MRLTPDHLTPQQYRDRNTSKRRTPEQRMCIAQIADAVSEACNDDPPKRSQRLQAIDWIRGTIRGKMSFALCCEALGLDTDWLRRELLRRVHEPDAVVLKRLRRIDAYREGHEEEK